MRDARVNRRDQQDAACFIPASPGSSSRLHSFKSPVTLCAICPRIVGTLPSFSESRICGEAAAMLRTAKTRALFCRDAVKQFSAAYAACPGPCARLVSVDSTDIVLRSDACKIPRRAAPRCRYQPLCVQRSSSASPRRRTPPRVTAPVRSLRRSVAALIHESA